MTKERADERERYGTIRETNQKITQFITKFLCKEKIGCII